MPLANVTLDEVWAATAGQAHRLLWCAACECDSPTGDWLLAGNHCPHCAMPAPDSPYHFQPPPAAPVSTARRAPR